MHVCSTFSLCLMFILFLYACLSISNSTYNYDVLLNIGALYCELNFIRNYHNKQFQWEIVRPIGSPWIIIPAGKRRRRHRERRQKRGCYVGLQTRLKRAPHKPAVPSIFLINAWSFSNIMEELELIIEAHKRVKDCSFMIMSETWLHPGIPEEAIVQADRTVHRAERNSASSKGKGGGMCIYSKTWCTNATITGRHCSPQLDYVTLKCRPFYLPRELTAVIVMAVYIPPIANTKLALDILLSAINKLQNAGMEFLS